MKSIDDHWTDWEAHVFGYGYGSGEPHTVPALKAWFGAVGRDDAAHGYDFEKLERACGPVVAWLLINALCKADIIQYGTSPRFGWLTDEGIALKQYIDSKTSDELVHLVCRDAEYVTCYPDTCNCGPNGYEAGRKCGNPFWVERR